MTSQRVCLAVLAMAYSAFAQSQQAQFNQVVNLNGDMQANVVQFQDGTKIETFSQTQRQMIVNQNQVPLNPSQVTGSTGEPFVGLMQNSVSIQTNGANDLVGGQIELPINMQMLQSQGISPDNTFVAQLSPDRQSWMIMEATRSVNGTDQTVRIVKRNVIDGEYMALGRQTAVTNNALIPFGTGAQNTANITGSGLQEAEFVDGLRMTVRSSQPMTIQTDVVNGIDQSQLPAGTQSVNNFRYSVRTNLAGVLPNLNQMVAVVQLPLNPGRLQQMAQQMGAQAGQSLVLGVAQRGVLQNPGGANAGNAAPPVGIQRRQGMTTSTSSSSSSSASKEGSSAPAAAAGEAKASATSSAASKAGESSATPAAAGEAKTSAAAPGKASSSSSSSASSIAPAGEAGAAGVGGASSSRLAQPSIAAQPSLTQQASIAQPAATQLLLSPTFTAIANQAQLDQVNMRIAVPVPQVDGEFIITAAMQGAAQPQQQGQGQQPAQQQQPGAAQPSGVTAPAPSQQGQAGPGAGQPVKRAAASSQGTVTIAMDDLNAMVERMNNGNYLPVGKMLNDYVSSQQGKQTPTRMRRRGRRAL